MFSTLCLLSLLKHKNGGLPLSTDEIKVLHGGKNLEIYRQRTQRTCLSLQGRTSLTFSG